MAQTHSPLISRIAFGSCGHQEDPQPVLDLVVKQARPLRVPRRQYLRRLE
ncbi:MAG: hypothetical protein IPM82_25780 [Saprospiraceae bacterium]|nr:hypothetical protein [Saprospiraceae bacterium]